MKIAIPFADGQVFQHFGHSERFKLYTVEDGRVVSEEDLSAEGSGHGALAALLAAHGVDALICGGIGGGARQALAERNISVFGGVTGSAGEAVQALLEKRLSFDPDARCDHHDHEHAEGHVCGDHGCGHTCGRS